MNNAFKMLILLLTLILGVCPLAKAQTGVNSSRAIRLAVVITPQYSGLMDVLIEDFQKATGIPVVTYSGTDVLRRARDNSVGRGKAVRFFDLKIEDGKAMGCGGSTWANG